MRFKNALNKSVFERRKLMYGDRKQNGYRLIKGAFLFGLKLTLWILGRGG